MYERAARILSAAHEDPGRIRPREFYNEGWMLKLLLDWAETHPEVEHPLSLSSGARWNSEVLALAGQTPSQMDRLAFYVVAPQQQIDAGVFGRKVTVDDVTERVRNRVLFYETPDRSSKMGWFTDHFMPTVDTIELRLLNWEDLVALAGDEYRQFYDQCLQYNRPAQG